MSLTDQQSHACSIAARARDKGASLIKQGASLLDVAKAVENYMVDQGALPAFPVNISIDNTAAHYTPSRDDPRCFKTGELVKLDVGAHIDGYVGDTAVTVEVGTKNWDGLIEASREALEKAIDVIRPGISTIEIGRVIQSSMAAMGFRPIKNLTGHGLGRYNLHADPSIPNFPNGTDTRLIEGMIIAVEPFSTNGMGYVKGGGGGNIYRLVRDRPPKSKNMMAVYEQIKEKYNLLPFAERWLETEPKTLNKLARMGTIAEYDILIEGGGGMVAQTEHTLHITSNGCEILTL